LRRDVLVIRRVRVGFQGIFDQLAGTEGAALVFRQVKLDGGAVSAGDGEQESSLSIGVQM
jgi:hypothetical protein